LGVDLSRVTGTGIGGRITGRDVETQAQAKGEDGRGQEVDPDAGASKHAEENPGSTPTRQTASSPPSASSPVRTAFRGIRRTIAQRLRHSINQAVHFTVMDEADVTALEVLRRKLAAASNEKLSLLPFVAAAVCQLLAGDIEPRFGVLNSTVDDEQEEILRHRAVHLGIATDTDNGLMVPVLRDARQLGVLEIARKIAGLAHGARHRTLATADLAGSTFTLSNFGAVAGRFATPIINYPEVAILAIGRARDGVIVRDGMLGVGKLLPLSLAADHRVVDGATASAALEAIIQLLQNPQELLAGAKDLRT